MATTEDRRQAAEELTAGALARGAVAAALLGAGLAGFVAGWVIGETAVVVAGVALWVLVFGGVAARGAWRGRRASRTGETATPVDRTPTFALARIEDRKASSSESADIPVAFDLTVAPDDAPAFRVRFTQQMNLIDAVDMRRRSTVVVRYPADEPWDPTVLVDPPDAWADRAETETVDSAPEETLVAAPKAPNGFCLLTLAAFLLGAAIVVGLLRGELFEDDPAAPRPPGTTATVDAVAADESMLEPGEMRRGVDQLIAMMGTDKVVSFRIEEDSMSAEAGQPANPRLVDGFGVEDGKPTVNGPRGTLPTADPDPLIDLRALPYERLPQLVQEAKTALGITAPTSWNISVDHDPVTRALEIEVTVRDAYGSASLVTDTNAQVVARTPR